MSGTRKIRGQRKLTQRIEGWRTANLELDLQQLAERQYEYVKVWISPWDNLRYKERDFTGPRSTHRTSIVQSLIDIYDSWEQQLNQLGEPFYLKIWLYEPRVTSSQVVCATGERINYYDTLFREPENQPTFPDLRYKSINDQLKQFNWEPRIDEEIIENDFWPIEGYATPEDYYFDQSLYRKLERSNHRREEYKSGETKGIRYFVPKGTVWIGGRK